MTTTTTEDNRRVMREAFEAWQAGTAPADGDTVIVLWAGHGIANDGQPYENTYAWFMRIRDGLVVDGTAFYDSISFNDLLDARDAGRLTRILRWTRPGSSSRHRAAAVARSSAAKLAFSWAPSQNGLVLECPQRHRAIVWPTSYALPSASTSVTLPATR
ncbi:MAG: uncharacterized protein V7607_5024 [Solirubrobacteraceae bacterium]